MAQQQQPYHGPLSMAESRYANPQRREEVAALLASNPELKEKKNAESILGSREKKETGSNAEREQSDAFRFAQAQADAIQEEVVRHIKDVDRTVSSVKTTIRQILSRIRETIKNEAPETAAESLRAVDGIWDELEKLLEATRKAKEAAPHFVEKCKENASILVAAKVQETQDGCQWELDRKDKRAQLLHEQNAGQIQAYKDVEANYNHKTAELQERLTRVRLEQGLLREELDASKIQLAILQKSQDNAVKIAENLQKQVEDLKETKKVLAADNENLCTTLKEAEAKLKASGENATENFENELRKVNELLQKEQKKSADLDTKLTVAYQKENLASKELERAKIECNLLSEKYNSQSGVFKKMTDDLKLQTKKMTILEDELSNLQQEKIKVEKEREQVVHMKDSLEDQHDALQTKLAELRKENESVESKSQQLTKRLEQVEKENDGLEAENRDLRTKQVQHDDVTTSQKKAESEIATLRATIQNMKTVSPATDKSFDASHSAKEIEDLKIKASKSEEERVQWEQLARKAMAQFREVRDKASQIDELEKSLDLARTENDKLKITVTELKSAGTSQDKYWHSQYNKLLASLEN